MPTLNTAVMLLPIVYLHPNVVMRVGGTRRNQRFVRGAVDERQF